MATPLCALVPMLTASGATTSGDAPAAWRQALTFHASFDHGLNADFAAGDPKLYTAPSAARRAEATPGLPAFGETRLAEGQGRFGHALRFTKKRAPLVFFSAAKNVTYQPTNWSGTVSFWLSTDPPGELEPGFCDPIQITPRQWNDAAFFVEFEKRTNSIPFRLGAYADFKVWNPANRKFDDIPPAERPLVPVDPAPFARGRWTHVVFTWENFNTGRADGVARLYLDGEFRGALTPRTQTFTWDPEKTLVMLGLSYLGLWDELAVFNRALTAGEVRALHQLKDGVRSLHAR